MWRSHWTALLARRSWTRVCCGGGWATNWTRHSDRLAKVRALTRLYYAGVLLSASAAVSGPLADRDLSTPTVEAFRRAVHDGQIDPGSPKAKHILGKMYLASFMTGDVPPGLDAAV